MEDLTTKGNLDEILTAPGFNHFLYPVEFFNKRLREEFMRTNRNGRPMVFIKIYVHQFELFSDWNKTSMAIRSWKISVLTLLSEVRFVDVIGFLPDGGIGILLFKSDVNTLQDILKRISRHLYDAGLINVLRIKPSNTIFEAYFHAGRKEPDEKTELQIQKFNSQSGPYFKLSRLRYQDTLPKSAVRSFRGVFKRVFDFVACSLAMILLCWLYLICAILVKVSDPKGPVIFKQVRVGKNGKHFTMYKFRTMYTDAEERKKELEKLNESDGPTFKMKNDPRVFPMGRFLRKFSLDELPQLWNVVKGEMAIVGPRPPIPSEVATYEPWHYMRLAVTPGLTCFWQVSGRSNVNFEEWMRLDNRYVKEDSIKTDLTLIAKTFKAVFRGEGAY